MTNVSGGRIRLKRLVWRIGVLIAALLGALLALPMLVLGLVVAMPVVLILTLTAAALFATLGAGWSGTLLAPDHTRTRLLLVVGVCEAIAAVLAIVMSMLEAFVDVFIVVPAAVIIVVASASWATWRFRGPRGRMAWTARLTLALAVAVFVVSYELLSSGYIGSSLLGLLFYLPIAPLPFVVGVGVASVVMGAVLAVWRFRRRGDQLGMDAAVTLGLVGVGPLLIIGVLSVAELLGLVGP